MLLCVGRIETFCMVSKIELHLLKLYSDFAEGKEGVIKTYRPKVIGDYNISMGGVDLVDMRIIYYNSKIMELYQW